MIIRVLHGVQACWISVQHDFFFFIIFLPLRCLSSCFSNKIESIVNNITDIDHMGGYMG